MANPAAAIGAGTSLVGGLMASRSSRKATESSARMSQAQLDFEREKYRDWQETYGGIEDNLSKYYDRLTPDFYETVGLEALEAEREKMTQRIQESFAQRGIDTSGVSAATELATELSFAEKRADIRRAAPGQAAEEKRQFLQVGLGQNPGQGVSSALSQRAQTAAANASAQQAVAGKAMQSAVKSVGTALSDYYRGDEE